MQSWTNFGWNLFEATGDVEAYLLAKDIELLEMSNEVSPEIDKIFDAFDRENFGVKRKDELTNDKGNYPKK